MQRQVFSALSQIAKHNVDLAEMVVEADVFPRVLTSLKDADEYVKKNTATLIREIAKHTPEVSDASVKEADSFTVNPVIFCFSLYLARIQLYSFQYQLTAFTVRCCCVIIHAEHVVHSAWILF